MENERRVLAALGVDVTVVSIYRPPDDLRGPTGLSASEIAYPPGRRALAAAAARWMLRRPLTMASNLLWAVRTRSQTLLTGSLRAGWLASHFEDAGVEVVHAHFATESACTSVPAARLLGVPSTFTIHAHEIYLRGRAIPALAAMADRVITVCEYNVTELATRWPRFNDDPPMLVYCGVDLEAFACKERAASPELRVVSVGRLVDIKGFDLLIDAVAILRDRGIRLRVEIVGEGPLRGDLQRKIDGSGVGEIVELVGAVPPDAVAARLRAADVFVLPCRVDASGNRDSMPVVIKEAMASCVPVVATSVAGVPEMVDDDVGRLVPPEDAAAIADALEEFQRLEPSARQAMGARARGRVDHRFNLETETQKLVSLFEELLR